MIFYDKWATHVFCDRVTNLDPPTPCTVSPFLYFWPFRFRFGRVYHTAWFHYGMVSWVLHPHITLVKVQDSLLSTQVFLPNREISTKTVAHSLY